MFPWLAFGHFHPFLHLSKSLITSTARRRRIKVSFLSTPRNLSRLPHVPPHLSSLLQLVPLPMPTTVDGLTPAAEVTADIPPDKMVHLKLAADQLAGPLTTFLDAAAPDIIICDFLFNWLPPLANRRGVRTIFFSTYKPLRWPPSARTPPERPRRPGRPTHRPTLAGRRRQRKWRRGWWRRRWRCNRVLGRAAGRDDCVCRVRERSETRTPAGHRVGPGLGDVWASFHMDLSR